MSSPRDDFAISTRAHLLNSTRYQANLDERSEYLRHASVKKFGITTMTDGATIQKHPLLNFMGACVIWPKALFLKCVDCTDHLAAGGSKDAEYVTEHMLSSLRSLPHPRYMDLIICDGAGDMKKFRYLIEGVYSWLYTIWCISHILNLVMKKAASHKKIDEIIKKGKKIVDRFGGSIHFEHSLFVTTSAKFLGLELIGYVDPRFGLYFLMLHRLHVLKPTLLACVNSPAYAQKQFEDDDEATIINDSGFWEDVEQLVKLTWPLMQLIRYGDERIRPTLHLVYTEALKAEERLEAAGSDVLDGGGAALLEAFRHYKEHICSDIAMAASLCDTKTWANNELRNVPECKAKLVEYIESFEEQYEEKEGFSTKAQEEMLCYLNGEGVFSRPVVRADARNMSARRFFDKYEASVPHFSRVALPGPVSTISRRIYHDIVGT